jgi:hypothetical protein
MSGSPSSTLQGYLPNAKAAERRATKSAWNAAPPFPVASDPSLWSGAIAAATRANSIADAALTLAEHGVPVFLVSVVDKKPLNKHGVYSATTNIEVVRREFTRRSDALIAVPMGRRTGVFAIDVDASPPHAHDGIGAWSELETKNGATTTRVHSTSSGGKHLLFRWRPDRPVGCQIKGIPAGVECKGEGGSIIFPPSMRGGRPYAVANDVEPADAPDWLLDMVAPTRTAQLGTPRLSVKASINGDGSPYGLKALDNACAKLAKAGPGERDRAVSENVLAIGSLAAGGELNDGHALRALKDAGQSSVGASADYSDKIERAFERGMQSPRTAPKTSLASNRAARRRTKAAGASAPGMSTDDGSCPSCPSCPSYPHVLHQPGAEKTSQAAYDGLAKRTGNLDLADEAGARVILDGAVKNSLSEFQIETLIKLLNIKVGFAIRPLRKLLAEMRAEAAEAAKPSPEERERFQRKEDEGRKREADEKREALWRSCSRIAESPTLLADMEAVVHGVGVVGEGAAIRGAYISGTSRLLWKRAICLLRRGAAAGGKNFLLSTVLRLMPIDSVVVLSSGSPMSLVYYGGGDEDALKHKVLYVQEAAILAEKNGVESPLTVLLRVLISEGQIDHLIAVPKPGDTPVTLKIKRNGPVAVCITSARDNIESEMLTRLMTSDADESREQTMAVVKGMLSNDDSDDEPNLTPWLDYQQWLELEAPYQVSVPFGVALYTAYEKRLQAFPNALQLRMRRDISGLISAIKTSAILHKVQRDRDARGRIVATIDDYRHAHEAFDEGVSSLYGVKTRKEIIAVVKAVEDLGVRLAESVKVTVAALRKKLGINSNSTANDRLMEAVECGALEIDDEASGTGKGRPRYFKLLKTSRQIVAERGQGVFPPPEDVLREINCPPSLSSEHADKTDRKDKTDETDDRGHKLVEGGAPTDVVARPFRRDVKPKDAP